MDTSNLHKNYHKLMTFLIKNGYRKDALIQTKKCIRIALKLGSLPEINSYEKLFFLEVKNRGYKDKEPRYNRLKTYIGNVWQFDLYGKYPDGSGSRSGFLAPLPLYNQLHSYFQSIIDYHSELGGFNGKLEKTVWTEGRAAMNFFKHVQDQGANTL